MKRNTSQRQAIREAFAGAGRPLSVPEAHAAARKAVPRLGSATVYHAINDLVAEGFLKAVELPASRRATSWPTSTTTTTTSAAGTAARSTTCPAAWASWAS